MVSRYHTARTCRSYKNFGNKWVATVNPEMSVRLDNSKANSNQAERVRNLIENITLQERSALLQKVTTHYTSVERIAAHLVDEKVVDVTGLKLERLFDTSQVLPLEVEAHQHEKNQRAARAEQTQASSTVPGHSDDPNSQPSLDPSPFPHEKGQDEAPRGLAYGVAKGKEMLSAGYGWIAQELNRLHRRRTSCKRFTEEEIAAFFRIMAGMMVTPFYNKSKYLEGVRMGHYIREGVDGEQTLDYVTVARYRLILSALNCDLRPLFELYGFAFSNFLQSFPETQNAALLSVDESMMAWKSHHKAVKFIDRKPNQWGVIVYIGASQLTNSKKPVVFFMIPKLASSEKESNGYRDVIKDSCDKVVEMREKKLLPNNVTFTMDALFPFPDLLTNTMMPKSIYGSFGMREREIFQVMKHGLKPGHHRVYKHKEILYSCYRDPLKPCNYVMNASSFFKVVGEVEDAPISIEQNFSDDFIWLLYHLGGAVEDDIKQLAASCHNKVAGSVLGNIAISSDIDNALVKEIAEKHTPSQALLDSLSAVFDMVGKGLTPDETSSTPSSQPRRSNRKRTDTETATHKKVLEIIVSKLGYRELQKKKVVSKNILKVIAQNLGVQYDAKAHESVYFNPFLQKHAPDFLQRLALPLPIPMEDDPTPESDLVNAPDVGVSHPSQREEEDDDGGNRGEESSADQCDGEVAAALHALNVTSVDDILNRFPERSQLKKELFRVFPRAPAVDDCVEPREIAQRIHDRKVAILSSGRMALDYYTQNQKEGKPPTTVFHGLTFNFVDMIDQMLSYIPIKGKNKYISEVSLKYLLRLCIVQSHSLMTDSSYCFADIDFNRYVEDEAYKKECKERISQAIKEYARSFVDALAAEELEIIEKFQKGNNSLTLTNDLVIKEGTTVDDAAKLIYDSLHKPNITPTARNFLAQMKIWKTVGPACFLLPNGNLYKGKPKSQVASGAPSQDCDLTLPSPLEASPPAGSPLSFNPSSLPLSPPTASPPRPRTQSTFRVSPIDPSPVRGQVAFADLVHQFDVRPRKRARAVDSSNEPARKRQRQN